MGDHDVQFGNFTTFGDLLKYLRRRARLTQRELSIAAGYSESQICRLEAGLRAPDPASLMALFVPALGIQDEPETISRLLKLAILGRPPSAGGSKTSGQGVLKDTVSQAEAKSAHPHNLPNQLTSFIGRENEIAALHNLVTVGPTRLVTLTGSGGVGKTRLAIRMGFELLSDFSDGVWIIELAPLDDPGMVARAAAHSLGILLSPGQTDTQALCEFLAVKQVLLILDNCEHVIEAAAEMADAMLRACPNLRILATSRELLGVNGETLYHCPSLSTPDEQHLPFLTELAQNEAVRLFCERAVTHAPSFLLVEENSGIIAHICQRLDGIPLAIELAAARVRLLGVEQISSHLDDAFHLLTTGSRTALPRHQTLRALIDWSYALLSEKERQILQRLSVFAGEWDLEAAEVVCTGAGEINLASDEILGLLSNLVDKSLVLMILDSRPGSQRFRMLETIRQYARESIPGTEWIKVRERHLDYYLSLALQAEPNVRGKNQRMWLDRLDMELDNIRQALEWAVANDIEKGLHLATALNWFWQFRDHLNEGDDWLGRLLAAEDDAISGRLRTPARSILRGRALNTYGNILINWGKRQKALAVMEEAQSIFLAFGEHNQRDWAFTLMTLGYIEKDIDRAISISIQAANILNYENEPSLLADVHWNLGTYYLAKGDLIHSRTYAEECLRSYQETGDKEVEGAAMNVLSILEMISGNFSEAAILMDGARSCYTAAGDLDYVALLGSEFALSFMIKGEYLQALSHSKTLLPSVIEQNSHYVLLETFLWLAWETWALKDYESTVFYCQNALALQGEMPESWFTPEYFLGRVALSRRDFSRSDAYLKEYLLSWDQPTAIFFSYFRLGLAINALAVLAAVQGQVQRAAVLLGAQDGLFNWVKGLFSLREREEFEDALIAVRASLGEDSFTSAWNKGRTLTIAQAIQLGLAVEELDSS